MTVSAPSSFVREAVGIFRRPEDLQDAIDVLLSSGFHRSALSLLAGEHTVVEKLGHLYSKVQPLADDEVVPRTAYVSPEAVGGAEGAVIGGLMYVGAVAATGAVVASGGSIGALLVATVVSGGAGALLGSILATVIGKHRAHHLQEQLERGGLLLWVRTVDGEEERKATRILRSYGAYGVHVHGLPAG